MSLQTVLDIAQVRLSFKQDKLGVHLPSGDNYLLRGEPRVVIKAFAKCMREAEMPVTDLSKYDLLSYGLKKDATEKEVTEYRASETEPAEYTTAEAVEIVESGPDKHAELDDCVIKSDTNNKLFLKAIQTSLGRGNIDGNQLLLGQTASALQVAKKIKPLFDAGVERLEKGEPEKKNSWAEEAQESVVANPGDQGEAVSDGSCETWINRHIKMDFNKLARGEEDFFLHSWLETKNISSGGQKRFFSKVPRTVLVKNWAKKITELLRAEGVDVGNDEVDVAGLWAIRKYNGQINVVGSGENRRVVRKN